MLSPTTKYEREREREREKLSYIFQQCGNVGTTKQNNTVADTNIPTTSHISIETWDNIMYIININSTLFPGLRIFDGQNELLVKLKYQQ